ncbi:hypothetical protein LB542_04710 [Mesorhizobium sp. BR1-1-9]|uniref:hypothetical protein n=1 Tax=unclassified Mesorhizobium TaxID=325217 RepID=UPI001CD07B5D|nr:MULTISPECIES: hypothetical protein [unclassified Mesorhizobium]MBZ9870164.1 hypothetical protein [Mesorhizobium sp. BR1-1-9]MBZ9943953.1 hypothetical protein [Mesorhizobium sp. BR1-1-13]
MTGTSNTAIISQPNLAERFGVARAPSLIRDWETEAKPKSLVKMTREVGAHLRSYRDLAQNDLFWNVSQCSSFIWAMGENGEVFVAFEEIVVEPDGDALGLKEGYPRRRGYPTHPADEKKLGHPTLIGNGHARIAGELFLDVAEEKLHWFVNCGSGRYCRDVRPNGDQSKAIHEFFMELIDDAVRFDDPFR